MTTDDHSRTISWWRRLKVQVSIKTPVSNNNQPPTAARRGFKYIHKAVQCDCSAKVNFECEATQINYSSTPGEKKEEGVTDTSQLQLSSKDLSKIQ